MSHLFVTGMIRSGTSLIQMLLSNHHQLFLAYQPCFQFYISVKKKYIDEFNLNQVLPLDDGMRSSEEDKKNFYEWLNKRKFTIDEIKEFLQCLNNCENSYFSSDFKNEISLTPGNFFEIFKLINSQFKTDNNKSYSFTGSKEVLCEEYVPALAIDGGVRCLMIIRDPRAMIVSSSYGQYFKKVGDRYPILMLIRLWRKSVAYCLAYKDNPNICIIRYEDLIEDTNATLARITKWLNIDLFPNDINKKTLLDNKGEVWKGNSSFGDKNGVHPSKECVWLSYLSNEEIRFIEACTKSELNMLGYAFNSDLRHTDITDFSENIDNVRETYLEHFNIDTLNLNIELDRWDIAESGEYKNRSKSNYFLFPHIFE